MKDFEAFKLHSCFNKKAYELGREEEVSILPVLHSWFKDNSIDFLPEGSTFDFQGENKYIEFKRRYCVSNYFSDTAIGHTKITKANVLHSQGHDVFFVFKFTDGVFSWKFDPNQPLRRGHINNILHYFIPRSCLSLILL